jgi:hypothetical protein
MTAVTRAPTRFSGAIAFVAAVVAALAGGYYSWAGLGIGAVGAVVFAAGLLGGRDGVVTLGAVGAFVAVLVGGVQGAPVPVVLVGVAAAVVAWDAASNALGVGRQLGRETDTRRLEVVDVLGSVAVGATSAGVGYGIYLTASGGQPIAALLFALVAAVALVEALR